ncbi:adenylyl cyclase-associated protein 2 isoform X2 [Eurytemora carolleeae]|nr:adenylyl cyclase-associated protein 2 isoform X2 [Eurytemora carolleeae]|eukprot:XP_023327185.1 adenylyl cyclase-associated protein 2-like isoform X2 [Eurytemora affinis]
MPGVEELSSLVARLELVAARLEGASGSTPVSQEAAAQFVAAFDDILAAEFKTFIEKSKKIGGDVATIAGLTQAAFTAERNFLNTASKSKKPSDKDLPLLLKPISDKISEIQEFREKNRRSEFFNHLSAISESIPALGWVAVSPAPSPYVKEMNDAGQFYTNRVLKDWKEKSADHVDWVKSWVQTLNELQSYVKKYHTTGLLWNPAGSSAAPAPGAFSAPSGPPLPPPPPPPGTMDIDFEVDPAKAARGDLMSSLNKGADITKGLKKVSDDQKTHKNPTLRSTGVVPSKDKPAVPTKTFGIPVSNKPPKLELDGKKWIVEYFKGNPNLSIEDTETNQSVYVFKCEGSTIKVSGKCNNIILDSCKKTAVVFDSVVSSCEFINCQSVQMQVTGSVPTISVDKTDGCQMYLSKDSLNAEIVSAKSSEMNVMIPQGDDFVEQPIPEQFKTVIKAGKLSTSATESV